MSAASTEAPLDRPVVVLNWFADLRTPDGRNR